jgi:hypothetical protein
MQTARSSFTVITACAPRVYCWHVFDAPHSESRGMLAIGGELVWGVAPHEYRNHLTRWACPAPCDLSGGGMVWGASHEDTAYRSLLAPGEKTERVWYDSSSARTTGALPLPQGRDLRAGKEGHPAGARSHDLAQECDDLALGVAR